VLDSTKELSRFSELRERVWRECVAFLTESHRTTGEFVQNLINMEVAYINTDNPEFDKIRSGVYRLMAAHQQGYGQKEGTPAGAIPVPVDQAGAAQGSGPIRRVDTAGDGGIREGAANLLVRESWKPHYLKLNGRVVDTLPFSRLHSSILELGMFQLFSVADDAIVEFIMWSKSERTM